MTKKKRLVLIDGHAIIHRAYHALPPLTGPGGQPTNAVYGFVNMLLRAVEDLAPTHLAVCFDSREPNFRQEIYIAYQAHRPEADQELQDQVNLVKEVVEAAGVPVVIKGGFEADDLIGTLAKKAAKKGVEVIIVTGDRDLLQLVDGNIKVYAPIRGLSEARLFGKKDVAEYLGVSPSQVVDYKGLIGDASDNYPGVQGIGPKTAVFLLGQYKSLDGVYKALKAGKISGSLKNKLEEGEESAKLSQRLAKIVTNAPVDLNLTAMELENFQESERFVNKLKEFGFKSLVKRLEPEKEDKEDNGQMELV